MNPIRDVAQQLGVIRQNNQYFTAKPIAQLLEFYLVGPVEEPSEYVEWFEAIRHAGPQDIVKIHINSGGGNVDAALQFLRCLSETEAQTIASVEGSCMSAATMIMLACSAYEITPHSLFMFHNYSGGTIGKGGEMVDQVQFERRWSEAFLHDLYLGFLSKKEIKQMLNNKDIWLTSEEVVERLNNYSAMRNTPSEE